MKIPVWAALACALTAGPALAQKAPSEVTDKQIATYKADALKQCTAAGTARKDPPEKVSGFCKCMIETLEKSVSRSEWQQLYFYAKEKRALDEMNVLAPHRGGVKACAAPPPA